MKFFGWLRSSWKNSKTDRASSETDNIKSSSHRYPIHPHADSSTVLPHHHDSHHQLQQQQLHMKSSKVMPLMMMLEQDQDSDNDIISTPVHASATSMINFINTTSTSFTMQYTPTQPREHQHLGILHSSSTQQLQVQLPTLPHVTPKRTRVAPCDHPSRMTRSRSIFSKARVKKRLQSLTPGAMQRPPLMPHTPAPQQATMPVPRATKSRMKKSPSASTMWPIEKPPRPHSPLNRIVMPSARPKEPPRSPLIRAMKQLLMPNTLPSTQTAKMQCLQPPPEWDLEQASEPPPLTCSESQKTSELPQTMTSNLALELLTRDSASVIGAMEQPKLPKTTNQPTDDDALENENVQPTNVGPKPKKATRKKAYSLSIKEGIPVRRRSRISFKRGKWITNDSEFVVLEL